MANHKSAIKRIRQNERCNEVNSRVRTALRTQIKKLQAAIDAPNVDEVKALMPGTVSAIDRAAQKGVVHRNTASRMKSRLNAQARKAAQGAES